MRTLFGTVFPPPLVYFSYLLNAERVTNESHLRGRERKKKERERERERVAMFWGFVRIRRRFGETEICRDGNEEWRMAERGKVERISTEWDIYSLD